MPKPGYVTITLPQWISDLIREGIGPGENPKNFLIGLLKLHFENDVVEEAEKNWRIKFGRN
jgi:hypothetical protein